MNQILQKKLNVQSLIENSKTQKTRSASDQVSEKLTHERFILKPKM